MRSDVGAATLLCGSFFRFFEKSYMSHFLKYGKASACSLGEREIERQRNGSEAIMKR